MSTRDDRSYNSRIQHTWLAIFVPALIYYIYSCASSTNKGGRGGRGVLSSLQLSQPYTIIATKLHVHDNNDKNAVSEIISVKSTMAQNQNHNKNQHQQLALTDPMETILQTTPLNKYHFSAMTWLHDPDIGRGLLLLSDSMNSGRVWSWEVGGGPITIGRSLHMNTSGCRSGLWNPCPPYNDGKLMMGSSGLTIQTQYKAEHFCSGKVIIGEKGERRIVRIEEDGARTPLVVNVPTLCSSLCHDEITRLENPVSLLYTPFGDLIFSDEKNGGCTCDGNEQQDDGMGGVSSRKIHNSSKMTVAGVYRLREAAAIPSIPAALSRAAHGWTSVTGTANTRFSEEEDIPKNNLDLEMSKRREIEERVELIYRGNMSHVSGIAMGPDLSTLFIAGCVTSDHNDIINDKVPVRYIITKITLEDDEDELVEDNFEGDQSQYSQRGHGLLDDKAKLVFDMTSYFSDIPFSVSFNVGPAITIDKLGNIFVTFPGGLGIIGPGGNMLATIPFTDVEGGTEDMKIPNSISHGHDGYLYVSCGSSLMRMKVKALPLEIPTDLFVPARKNVVIE